MHDVVTMFDIANEKCYTYAEELKKIVDKLNEVIGAVNNGLGQGFVKKENLKPSNAVYSNEIGNNNAFFLIPTNEFILEPNCIYELSANGDYELPSTILFLLTGDSENPCVTTLPYLVQEDPAEVVSIVINIIPNYENNSLSVTSIDSNYILRNDDVLSLRKIIKLED